MENNEETKNSRPETLGKDDTLLNESIIANESLNAKDENTKNDEEIREKSGEEIKEKDAVAVDLSTHYPVVPAKRSSRRSREDSDQDSSSPEEDAESSRSRKRKKKKSHGISKVPPIPKFERHPVGEQFAAWRERAELFYASLSFAPGLDESQKISLIVLNGGEVLRDVINTFKLMPGKVRHPFETLMVKLDEHFERLTDATLTHQAIVACVQRQGESASDYYIRLMKLLNNGRFDSDFARTHFLNGLLDRTLVDMAITGAWKLEDIVAAASRRESVKFQTQSPLQYAGNSSNAAMLAAVDNRGSFQQQRPSPQFARQQQRPGFGGSQRFGGPQRSGGPSGSGQKSKACPNCGITNHRIAGVCPAKGKTCMKCGGVGHFKKVCRNSARVNAVANSRSSQVRDEIEDWD